MTTAKTITELLADDGALFVLNHSGGKDSQAQMIDVLARGVPARRLLVVHATLGRFEWDGALELAQKQAADAGVAFRVALAIFADGSTKDFAGMVRDAKAKRPTSPSFPSPKIRQCTSDLKRGPIEVQIRRYMKEHGFKTVVNCQGIRAAESDDRAERRPFVYLNQDLNAQGKPKSGLARAGREAYEWLPIFELTTFDVWCKIFGAGQKPHEAYYLGNQRLSCVFCIMGKGGDLLNGAKQRPELFAEMVALEKEVGYTMHMGGKSLEQLVAEAEVKAQAGEANELDIPTFLKRAA
jgi:3'-phosphoadenosine 5'-phosphosulfate sulfotransferase (PAPS reductase)/FAD synthetase